MVPHSKTHRGLVIYYGGIQALHLLALAYEALTYLRTSQIVLLAPPPAGGWSAPVESTLLILGSLDALLILASIPFVWGTLREKDWGLRLGALVLTAFSLTALAFAVVTLPSGVWLQQPAYLVEALLFAPIGLLAALHLRWLTRPEHSSSGAAE